MTTVTYVGGCKAVYHRLEPTVAPITSALEEIGADVKVSGMYHPDNTDAVEGDYSAIGDAGLAGSDAAVLFTTGTGNGADIDALLRFVRSGGALIGIHCAADSFKDNAEYVAALGGSFRTHPAPLDIAVEFTDTEHPITQGLPPFTVHDELYLFNDYDPGRVHLLAQTNSFDDNGPVPVMWTREEGKGRVFYISLGHMPEVLSDPNWRELFQRGVKWALGE